MTNTAQMWPYFRLNRSNVAKLSTNVQFSVYPVCFSFAYDVEEILLCFVMLCCMLHVRAISARNYEQNLFYIRAHTNRCTYNQLTKVSKSIKEESLITPISFKPNRTEEELLRPFFKSAVPRSTYQMILVRSIDR